MNNSAPATLIIGPTGSNGGENLKLLAARSVPVRAMVRDASRAEAMQTPNVQIVEGDFDRPKTLHAVLEGVERAFLLTNSSKRAPHRQAVASPPELVLDSLGGCLYARLVDGIQVDGTRINARLSSRPAAPRSWPRSLCARSSTGC